MTRVLFVDDEPNVLSGLRRMLRAKRDDWDMTFIESGEEALSLMAGSEIDVVVSDMRMPGMNGAELLSRVKEEHPGAIRIVLSGEASRTEVMRVVSPAHQYLAKPCDAEELRATIDQALALRRVLSAERLMAIVSQVDSLPSLPQLYYALCKELNADEPSIDRVAEIIEQDVAMAAKVLKLVSSAFFGVRRELTSIRHAVSFLGLDTIATLVLAEEAFAQFDAATISAMSLDAIWAHSGRTARLAAAVARSEKLDRTLVDHCFTAGMLHEVGKLILAKAYPDEYADVLARAAADSSPTSVVEREVLGASHGEVGAYLLGLWGLPDPIVEAVAYHTLPSEHPRPMLDALTIVHVADVLSQGWRDPAAMTSRLDEVHLGRLDLLRRLDAWVAFAEETMGKEAAA
ncbi:MAG: response regulator [Gemmatimonadetes bacterium]|nr:response regulator [Gemmatimonadota bacterium]